MLEREMWEAYAKQAGGVTFDGKPLPTWDELGEDRQICWKAAASVCADEIDRLREALTWIERHPVEESKQWEVAVKEMKRLARSALQQKESE